MEFLPDDHKKAWARLGAASPATHLDRDGMMVDADAACPSGFDLTAVRGIGAGLLVELTWKGDTESALEELDVAIYGYVARLSYDDVMIARRTGSDEVRYLVATSTEDGALGQVITVVVGGPRTERTLAMYHQVRRELDRT